MTAALTHALGAHVILGINIELDSKTDAADEAKAMVRGIGASSIEALELGNEPELYGSFSWFKNADGRHITGRRSGYDFSTFVPDFARIAGALPNLPLAGPATGAPKWIPELGRFLAAEPLVKVATLHRYPLQECFMPAASTKYPSIAHMLDPSASRGLADSVAPLVGVAHARHVALRIDEMNSVSCGGAPGVSNAFVSALWALDAMFQMARVGVDGVNIHTFPKATYELFNFTHAGGKWSGYVAPSTTASRCSRRPPQPARTSCTPRARSATCGHGRLAHPTARSTSSSSTTTPRSPGRSAFASPGSPAPPRSSASGRPASRRGPA